MVVSVTVVVAVVLGAIAYQYSRGQTQMLTMAKMAQYAELDDQTYEFIKSEAEKADRDVILGILGGIAVMVLALGLTGIIVTHKLVGPAFKMKRLLRDVRDGHLRVDGRLRRGDELQDLFIAFEEMVNSLRAAQEQEVEQLDAAIARAREAGTPDTALLQVEEVRDRMRKALG
jgi:nitrogen fixation/metabolism regulation signal transduction histidine kinase